MMNNKCGMFRAWVAASVVWIIFVVWLQPAKYQPEEWVEGQPKPWFHTDILFGEWNPVQYHCQYRCSDGSPAEQPNPYRLRYILNGGNDKLICPNSDPLASWPIALEEHLVLKHDLLVETLWA
jgi:hypothetical protein